MNNDDLDDDFDLEPHFKTPPKTHKIIGIVILVVASLGVAAGIYIQIAHAARIWPF